MNALALVIYFFNLEFFPNIPHIFNFKNLGVNDVNYEKIVPICVWIPFEGPTSSFNIKTPAWNLGLFVDSRLFVKKNLI